MKITPRTLSLPLLLLAACGYQGDPERFAQANTEELQKVAEELKETAEILRESAEELRLAAAEVREAARYRPAAGEMPAQTSGDDAASEASLELPMVQYAWDPNAGDASVSAELGGPGFTGEGWDSNFEFPAMGSADAVKGGKITMYVPDWPANIRQAGQDWNTAFNYRANDLCMSRLVSTHPITLEYYPVLATHWKISEDKMTYWYRINPDARWSDGSEVTAYDIHATWKLRTDPTLLEPSSVVTYGKMNEPEVLSKYMLKVTVNEESWKNFLYFSGMAILPAKDIESAGNPEDERGKAYLDEFNFKFTMSCGAYEVREEDINTGKSISIRRRDDWWAKDNPAFTGLNNIDEYRFIVVKDYNLAYEKLKKGEIDYYVVPKAEWWAKQIPELDQVKRGMIVPHKVFNDSPVGTAGMAINMSKAGLDDVRVRKALNHLNNRELKIEKLYYNEYVPLSSYYQGGLYQNPDNVLIEYDVEEAVRLLEEAGYSEYDDEGYRTKDGRRLRLTLTYRSKASERGLTMFQESCREAGVKIDLQLLTPASAWKNLRAKEFELMSTAWGALVFPNPETSYHSRYATEPDNNNVTGFANARVDELCAEYDQTYDVNRRIEIIQEVDGIVYNEYPYVLDHFGPAQRVAFWNKFSMPDFGALRFVDAEELMYTWWIDPEKEAALEAAKADPSKNLEKLPIENRFWQEWNAARRGR